MKYWIYYILAAIALLHPDLYQKSSKLIDYLINSDNEFWVMFSTLDILDLILHILLPLFFLIFGIRKQRRSKR